MTALRRMLRELMRNEDQGSPHYWASVAAAHCWIGLGLWGGLAVIFDRWTAVYVAPLAYLLLVEGVQAYAAPRITAAFIWGSLLDTVAFTFGCIAAAHLRSGEMELTMLAWLASMVVIAVGWIVRDRGQP